MAIVGQQNINIGTENQQAGSDSLYAAFNKVQNNFSTLFTYGSPYNNFVGSNGIQVTSNGISGTVTIVNTGVTSITAGTGITLNNANGNVTISASGSGGSGVTSVGVISSSLTVSNSPVISAGTIGIELPPIPVSSSFSSGTYIAPTVYVDKYGRITAIANTTSVGTVTSVAVQARGNGIVVSNSPITSSGTIYVENTGVTSLTAGTGINLSGTSGDITITALTSGHGITYADVQSSTLTVSGGPITSAGTITVDLPSNILVSGNITANTNIVAVGSVIANTITSLSGSGANIVINPDGAGDVVFPIQTEVWVQSNANSTSTTTGAIIISGGIGAAGNINTGGYVSVSNGFMSSNVFNGTYTDGIVVDYNTGQGRITVGASDSLIIRGNGITSPTTLLTVDSSGNANVVGSTTIGTFLKLTPGSAPSGPTKGTVYFDNSYNKLRVYNGTTWGNVTVT